MKSYLPFAYIQQSCTRRIGIVLLLWYRRVSVQLRCACIMPTGLNIYGLIASWYCPDDSLLVSSLESASSNESSSISWLSKEKESEMTLDVSLFAMTFNIEQYPVWRQTRLCCCCSRNDNFFSYDGNLTRFFFKNIGRMKKKTLYSSFFLQTRIMRQKTFFTSPAL